MQFFHRNHNFALSRSLSRSPSSAPVLLLLLLLAATALALAKSAEFPSHQQQAEGNPSLGGQQIARINAQMQGLELLEREMGRQRRPMVNDSEKGESRSEKRDELEMRRRRRGEQPKEGQQLKIIEEKEEEGEEGTLSANTEEKGNLTTGDKGNIEDGEDGGGEGNGEHGTGAGADDSRRLLGKRRRTTRRRPHWWTTTTRPPVPKQPDTQSRLLSQFFVFGTLFGIVCSISACSCFFRSNASGSNGVNGGGGGRRVGPAEDMVPSASRLSQFREPFAPDKPYCLKVDEKGLCYASPLSSGHVPPLPSYSAACQMSTPADLLKLNRGGQQPKKAANSNAVEQQQIGTTTTARTSPGTARAAIRV